MAAARSGSASPSTVSALALAATPGGVTGGPSNGSGAVADSMAGGVAGRGTGGPSRGAVAEGDGWVAHPEGGTNSGLGDRLAVSPDHGADEVRGTTAPAGSDGSAAAPAGLGAEVPAPEAAGPRTAFSPFDRASLEHAIDRVLEDLGGLGDTLPSALGPMGSGLAPAALAVTAGVLTTMAIRRVRRLRGEEDRSAGIVGLAFPGLPSSWDGSPR